MFLDFLLKPCSFLFIIFFTYFLKKIGLFKKELSLIVLKILMNITLPATVVTVFATFERDFSLCLLILLGLGAALGPYLLMYFLTRKLDKGTRACYMISGSGFNIGCYGLPIIQAFYGSVGGIISILFDIGNSIMMTSGNYAFTVALLNTEEKRDKIHIGEVAKKFFQSVSVDTYLLLLILALLGIRIPQVVADFVNPIASANAFLAMFMLGLLFSPPSKKQDWKHMIRILVFRYAIMACLSVLCFLFLPFSLEIRRIVVLLLLCPIGSMAPAFVEKCHGDGELAAFTNSVSTTISLIVMTVLAGYFGVN